MIMLPPAVQSVAAIVLLGVLGYAMLGKRLGKKTCACSKSMRDKEEHAHSNDP